MFLLSLLSVLVVLSVWLVTWHCHVVVVVERLQEVARIGGGGDEAEVDDDGGREGKCLFVHGSVCEFSANAAYAAQYKAQWSLT